ncbi:sensor domain CHASE-containing protein [Paeniglutamicibacter sulfureus]|uniref:Sensor domain CHASE-containing protein n=1 Tax=Paeniglutamicibacter sulfureus TaxID=43666 RepID=A0ABU2BPK0_9MICC|nr:sensor domain CHASE-containing protein [Paeniglutamicibacter sulfureus]
MESIRKRVKVITWLLIAALVVGTGAGLLSGVL